MTYIEKKKKISIRICYIELGLKCNFKCRHCYQGESQNVAITPEVINAICDNVLWIDELHFVGGEPMLYVDELRMILKIFKKRRIRVNYLEITTNMSIQSQEFAYVYNEWAMYIKRPTESGLAVSVDPFHLEFITMEQIRKNIDFYRKKCPSLRKRDRVVLFDNTTQKYIVITGRAENLTVEDLNMCNIVAMPQPGIGKNLIIPIEEKCKGDTFFNPCGYRCVRNCTNNISIHFRYDGSIHRGGMTLPIKELKKRELIIGNILKDNLYDAIMDFNNRCETVAENSADEKIIWYNKDGINKSVQTAVMHADYLASINELDEAKEHINQAYTILHNQTEEFTNTASLFNGLKKTLENLYLKIEEMQKHNTYGHIL